MYSSKLKKIVMLNCYLTESYCPPPPHPKSKGYKFDRFFCLKEQQENAINKNSKFRDLSRGLLKRPSGMSKVQVSKKYGKP